MTPPLDHILSPPAQQAVIAGLFLAVGWWVVAWQNARREMRHRMERVRDVQRALFAEIRAHVATLQRYDLPAYGDEISDRIESEPGFFPSIPTESNDAIFRAILSNIHVLPRATIDPLVLYYSRLNVIAAAATDLRGLDLTRIGAPRAAEMYRDYILFRIEALELGERAMVAIANNLDGTGKTARPRGPRPGQGGGPVNSRGAAPTVRGSA